MVDLKDSNEFINSCIDRILSQNNIINIVSQTILNRLKKSALDDEDWCRAIIDVTVDEVFLKLNVNEIVVTEIADFIKSPSRNKILPPFSASEPESDTKKTKSTKRVISPLPFNTADQVTDFPPTHTI